MGYDANVYRWNRRESKWVCRHRDGSRDLKSARRAGQLGNDGDWMIEWRAGGATFIPARDMFDQGTLWQWRANGWQPIYRRSTPGFQEKPSYLYEFSGQEGDILVESGEDEVLTIYDREGVAYEMEMELAAVFDDITETSDYFDVDIWGEPDPRVAPRERRLDEEFATRARIADEIIAFRNQIPAEYLGWENDPGKARKLGQKLVRILEEACPSPTPGTTAPLDYYSLASDMHSGDMDDGLRANGIDRNGGALNDDSSLPAVDYCRVAGETMAAVGALTDYIQQLRILKNTRNLAPGTRTGRDQKKGERRTAAGSAALDVPKMVGNALTATDKVINLVAECSKAASATSAVAQGVPFVNTVVGTVTFFRHVRKAHRARKRWSRYKRLLKKHGEHCSDDVLECLKYAIGKSGRRLRTQSATAATALTSGAGGTILGITTVVGGANAWNPVGWILLGTAAVGGAGIVGYKVYKRWRRKKRHAKRRQRGGIATPEELAKKLIEIAQRDGSKRDRHVAREMLRSFGVRPSELDEAGSEMAAMAMVKRHLTK